jgi:hypothetical protein
VSRAIESLVAEVIDRILALGGNDELMSFVRKYAFVSNDMQMLDELIGTCKAWNLDPSFGEALSNIKQRNLHNRVLTIGPGTGGSTDKFLFHGSIYKAMIRLQNQSTDGIREPLRLKKKQFAEELGDRAGIRFAEADVILDVPVPNRHQVGHLHMMTSDGSDPLLSQVSHVWESIGEDFEELARRARVFVAHKYEGRIKREIVELTLKHVFLGEEDDWVRQRDSQRIEATIPRRGSEPIDVEGTA